MMLRWLSVIVVACGLLAGCSDGAKKPAEDKKAATSDEQSVIADAIKKLPADEQAVAVKQKICPVSGEPLGSMGMPYKMTVKGRTVYLCCSGCEDEMKTSADKYFALLDGKK